MKTVDNVHVHDQGSARILSGGKVVQRLDWGNEADQNIMEVKGWVTVTLRERGKLVSKREGHNIWLNTGREYLAMLMSLNGGEGIHYRDDRIEYLGVGTGLQVENVNILNLLTPVSWNGSDFLKSYLADGSLSFPLAPSRTTVEYTFILEEADLTPNPGDSIIIQEMGLFTNGDQNTFAENGRDPSILVATAQSPVAYKAFEGGLTKTNAYQLEVNWQIRF